MRVRPFLGQGEFMSAQTSMLQVQIVTDRPNGYLQDTFETSGGKHAIGQRVVDYIQRVISGNEGAYSVAYPPALALSIVGNAVQASGTVTFSAAATANDQFIINGTTFTCVNSGATGNQWNKGTTATETAANLVIGVNASATALVTGQVVASSALGVVTITSLNYGVFGNSVTIAKGTDFGSVMTVSGARLTGGAVDPTAQTLSF